MCLSLAAGLTTAISHTPTYIYVAPCLHTNDTHTHTLSLLKTHIYKDVNSETVLLTQTLVSNQYAERCACTSESRICELSLL